MFSSLRRRLNRITYIDLDGRLCTVNPDGTDQRCLSGMEATYQFPTWSPDGKRIAAIGRDGGGGGVFLFRERGGLFTNTERQEVYYGQVQTPLYLYWAPDSSRLAFLVGYPQSIALYLSPERNDQESQLLETGQPFFWSWMPDGAYLFIHTGGMGEKARINFIDQEGGDWGQHLAVPGYFQAPAISSDGRYWAFAELNRRGQSRLAVEHHTTGERVTVPHEGAVAMSWQPGTSRLAFISPDETAQHFFGPLQMLELPSGRASCLINEQVLAFFWSPEGTQLAYFTLSESRAAGNTLMLDVKLLDAASGTVRHLATFRPPRFFVDHFLPIFDQFTLSHRLWSPEGDALVLPVLHRDQLLIEVVELSGRREPVAEGIMPSWSHN